MGIRDCCDTTAKILLVIFNSIFLACGIVILGVGIWIKSDTDFSNLGNAVRLATDEPVVEIVTWTFIGIGIFVLAVAFAGFIGVIRESKIIMGFYIVCVFIVFAAETSAGVYAGVREKYLIGQVKEAASLRLKTHYSDDDGYLKELGIDKHIYEGFNYVQYKWKCCGVNNYTDYRGSKYLEQLGNKIKPNATMSWACCNTTNEIDAALSNGGVFTVDAYSREACMMESIQATLGDEEICTSAEKFRCKGCAEQVESWIDEHMAILLGVGVGIGVLQLILMFLALWFCQTLGKYHEKKEDQ